MTSAANPSRIRFENFVTTCPSCWLLIGLALLVSILLSLPLHLPIGPNYWDLTLYEDAAHRINLGQVPNVDFRTPAGPLNYYLYVFIKQLFPNGHPALLASWSILLIALPLFAITILRIVHHTGKIKLAITVPFAFLAFMPFNSSTIYGVPGIDAFGIYNRQPALLLYILTTLIFFARSGLLHSACMGAILLALFFTKITAFAAAVPILAYAILTGRYTLRGSALLAIVMILPLIVLEASSGLVGSYMRGILELANLNRGGFVQRLAFIAATQFDVQISLVFIFAILFALEFVSMRSDTIKTSGVFARLSIILRGDSAWFAVLLAAALVFELQNTGSQEYIFLWPFLLHLLRRWWHGKGWLRVALIIAICFATIPSIMSIAHRAARTAFASLRYVALNEPILGRFGDVTTRRSFDKRARIFSQHYAENLNVYETLAKQGFTASVDLSLEPDFQFLWLLKAAEATKAIVAFEREHEVQISSILTLDFTDPIAFTLKRNTPRLVQIGRDPDRTITIPDAKQLAELAHTDALLAPRCPPMPFRNKIAAIYAAALNDRTRIALTPCWDMYVRKDQPGLAHTQRVRPD